jgi:2-phospho-L-lactate/phosphoenolpyruvate guanylyltransferase
VSLRVAALVPVKDPGHGKSRLNSVLGTDERVALNTSLARRTLDVCAEALGPESTFVVTASRAIEAEARARGMHVVAEAEPGDLNAALVLAGKAALAARAQALLVVPTDLVRIDADSVHRVVDTLSRSPGCVLVPDRRGSGTNMMGIAPARLDLFRFGELSLEKHRKAALDAGIAVNVRADALLALDLDLPEDLELWRAASAA